jgi:hypothetical protein
VSFIEGLAIPQLGPLPVWDRWPVAIAVVGGLFGLFLLMWLIDRPRATSTQSTRTGPLQPVNDLASGICPSCGSQTRPTDRYCSTCGSAITLPTSAQYGSSPALVTHAIAPRQLMPAYAAWPTRQRPAWVVALLTIVSLGFYWPIWFGQSWSELKRVVRDPGMSPGWHAFSLAVPFYSWNRVLVHFRTINEECDKRGVRRGVSPSAALLGMLISIIPGVGLLTFPLIMGSGQRALNRVWQRDYGLASRAKPCAGEWIALLALAVLLPAGLVAVASSPTIAYRVAQEFGDCRGWNAVTVASEPIFADEQAFWDELDRMEDPDSNDFRQLSSSAQSIRQQYQQLDHPTVLNRYVDLSISTMFSYETGFAAMARGDYVVGQNLLDEGDQTGAQAQAALRAANAECAG